MQVRMSWVEQFMNWYPRNTKLYRRRSKHDTADAIKAMSVEFDELKPFFMTMADAIWNKAKAAEQEERMLLCQSILQCTNIEQAKALVQQAVEAMVKR